MPRRPIHCGVLLAALLVLSGARADGASRTHSRVALIRHDDVAVHAGPSTQSRVLATLVQQAQVEVLSTRHAWSQVVIWASVQGWIRSREIVFRKPWDSVSTYHAPEIRYPVRAHPPARVSASAEVISDVSIPASSPGSGATRLRAGSRSGVTAWRQDATGKVWYRVHSGWVPGDALQFITPDPGLQLRHGRPLWWPVKGKGMWLTLGTIAESAPDALVRAALRNGITHLYVEAAISPLGFHGKKTVGPLLDAAHRNHLAVLAWVYPYLYDIGSDVALSRDVAAFRTSTGQRFDGIAADLERNVQSLTVRTYSQLVRAYLGPNYLLVAVTYPPQSFPTYPFTEAARQYNVIAPMDYWHQTKSNLGLDYGHMPYGYAYTYRYATDSVAAIRRVSGKVPVAPIGQAFDDFGRLEMGPHAPSAQEIQGFLAGSKASGSIGASFFQWMTVPDDEWRTIAAFHFSV